MFAGWRPSDPELAEHYSDYGVGWFDSEITRRRYRELLDSFEPYRRSGRILDMGCGAGYFLEEAARRGWEAYGTNFGERPLELSRGRGFTVVQAPISTETFPAGHFDVVTSFEVVEHLRDPIAEAQTLSRLLRVGGLLYCTTPNFDALTRRLVGPSWSVIEYPEHLIYFTGETLTFWLTRFGFSRGDVITTGISPGEILSRLRRSRDGERPPDEPGSSDLDREIAARGVDERLRQLMDGHGSLERGKRTLNQTLTALRAGDTLKARFVLDASPGRS